MALKMDLKANHQPLRERESHQLGKSHGALPPATARASLLGLHLNRKVLNYMCLKFLLLAISPHFTEGTTEILRSSVLSKASHGACGNLDLSLELLDPSLARVPPEHLTNPFRHWNLSSRCVLQDFATVCGKNILRVTI